MIIAGATTPTANEGEEQRSLFVWATIAAGKYPALNLLFHIPNEGKRSQWTGARMRSEGLKSGVPWEFDDKGNMIDLDGQIHLF